MEPLGIAGGVFVGGGALLILLYGIRFTAEELRKPRDQRGERAALGLVMSIIGLWLGIMLIAFAY